MGDFLIGIFFIALVLALSFGVSALIVKGICWCFGLAFSLKYAFGVWLVLILVSSFFRNSK